MGCGGAQEEVPEENDHTRRLVKESMRDFSYYIEKSAAKDALREFFEQSEGRNEISLEDAVLALREISITTTVDELKHLSALAQQPDRQSIGTDDFMRILIAKNNSEMVDCENCYLFLVYDKAFVGKIHGSQLEEILKVLGYSGDDVDADIAKQRGVEVLYYSDYKQIMQKYK